MKASIGAFLILLLASVSQVSPALGASPASQAPWVLVEVQNAAGLSDEAMETLLTEAPLLLEPAGIGTVWEQMDAPRLDGALLPVAERSPAKRLIVRLLPARHAVSTNPQALGEAVIQDGDGTYANLYLDRIRAFAARHRLPLGMAVAAAAAHEVGHLLRGDTVHTPNGLMRAHWDRSDADEIRRGALALDEDSACQIQKLLTKASSYSLTAAIPFPSVTRY